MVRVLPLEIELRALTTMIIDFRTLLANVVIIS